MRLSIAAFAAFIAAVTTSAQGSEGEVCGLYLAVSSTSTVEEPKWGLYAGKAFPKGVPVGGGEIAIQTHNLMGNQLSDGEQDEVDDDLSFVVEFFEQYIWVPQSSGGQFELDSGRIVTAVPGVGVLGAYNPKLTNADWNHTSSYFRESLNEEPGSSHPGRGAYSNFYNVGMKSVAAIPPGMEIFINYGDNWEPEPGEDEEENSEITREDYAKIDETVDKMLEFFDKHKDEIPEDAKGDIYNFLVRDVMAAAAGPKKGSKITAMLPDTPEELAEVKEAGGTLTYTEPTAVRSLEWLQSYGRCMDNIRVGPSTIPHAGRGAFANRKIAQDGLVAPVPLVQITNELIFNMHEIKEMEADDGEFFARASSEVTGMQLLYNYCYGHPESTMMFFPGGAGATLINHGSKDKANAKMMWSNHPNNHKHWFDLQPQQLVEEGNQHLGLLLEIVATRDIEEGEEILIDYGDEWQAAWDAHVTQWEAYKESGEIPKEWPLLALDLMQELRDNNKPFDQEGLPDNVMLKCFLMVIKPTDEAPVNVAGDKVRYWSEPLDKKNKKPVIDSENLFDCTILEHRQSDDEKWMYVVAYDNDGSRTIVKNVPHSALVLVDKPGTGDQFVSQAFRHYIKIPDDVFPQGPWRNAA